MDLVRGGLVLAALVGVLALVAGGYRRRPGRPGGAPFSGVREVGSAGVGAVVLSVLGLIGVAGDGTFGSSVTIGVVGGLVLGLGLRFAGPVTKALMGIIGVLAATATAWQFVGEDGPDVFATSYRWILVFLVLAVFMLTSLLFHLLGAFGGLRGLTLFGLVDVTTFVASPGGADVLSLGQSRAMIIFVLALALAAVLGFAASPFAVSLTALLATVAGVLLSLSGASTDTSGAGTIVALVLAALVAGFVIGG
jgi:hypothetical protein